MSYIHKPHIQPLEHGTPFQLLRHHAQVTPDKEALIFRDADAKRVAITFKEYEKKSEALATALLDIGLVHGDRVLLMLPTNEEFVFIHMGLNMIGALAVIVEQDAYPAIAEVKDLACVIANTDYGVQLNMDKTVQELHAVFKQGTLKAGVIVGHSKAGDDLLIHPKVYAYEKLCDITRVNEDSHARLERAQAQVQFDDPTFVLFTSGSTGDPKPIQFTNQGFVNGAWANGQLMAMDKDSILFCDGPFDWISGMGLGIGVVLFLGSTLVSFPPRLAFEGGLTVTIMKIIEEEVCSHAILLLYLLHDMVLSHEVSSIDLSNLVHGLTGGQPTSVALMKKLFSMFPHFRLPVNLYGSTETNMVARQVITKDSLDTLDNGVMEICAGFEVKIVDEDGRVAPVNVPGELCIRGSPVSFIHRDLLKDSEELKSPRDVGLGWHHTKDLATISQEGQLKILGRMDDLIKCASDSIQPIDIEQVLLEHPLVDKVIAVGVPDERLYHKICVCIILKEGHHDNQEVLRIKFEEWCKDKAYQTSIGLVLKPHYFVFFDNFPRTRTGKLNRKLLADLAAKEVGL